MDSWIAENPQVFIGVFVVVVIFFLLLFLISGSKNRKKEKETRQNHSGAEIEFDADVFIPHGNQLMDGGIIRYGIYHVNDQAPQILGRFSLLVPAGTSVIDLEYFMPNKSLTQKRFPRMQVTIEAQAGKKYTMIYNILAKEFEFKEANETY